MCDYCANHGHGKKWYLSARNLAKELATSQFVKDFCENYFGREIKPGEKSALQLANIPISEKAAKVDLYYRKFLHHQVVSSKEVLEVLELAGKTTEEHEAAVVLLPCICRYRVYGSDPNLRCFGVAFTSEYTKRFPRYLGGGHRYISTEAAYEILEKMVTEEPIVHAVSALGVPYLGMICNCDMNACSPYRSRTQYGLTSPFYKSHYRAKVNSQKCSGCGTCEENCPFGVAKLDQASNVAKIDQKTCFGCEICIRNCPEEAIRLIEVDESFGY
ncbi:MAG: DUF362 domain-containing protein [Candidatus Hodarchaeota archaeon]